MLTLTPHGIIRQPITGFADDAFSFKSLTVTESCKIGSNTTARKFRKNRLVVSHRSHRSQTVQLLIYLMKCH